MRVKRDETTRTTRDNIPVDRTRLPCGVSRVHVAEVVAGRREGEPPVPSGAGYEESGGEDGVHHTSLWSV